MEDFQFATTLDLIMGYYHIQLSPESSKLCTIVFTWEKYEYLRLPQGLCNSPDIFQEKITEIMYDLEYVRECIDDFLVLTKGNFDGPLDKLEQLLLHLQKAGLKICETNASLPLIL